MSQTVIRAGQLVLLFVALVVSTTMVSRGAADTSGEWRAYAATNAGTKYSPLDQINKDTVKNLRIAWRQSVTPMQLRQGRPDHRMPTQSQNTPLMVGGLLYMITGLGTVAALDPTTGKVVWFDLLVDTEEKPQQLGRVGRGVAYWTDGRDARVIAVTGQYLVALNAKTGKRYAEFGNGGTVDLTKGYDRPVETYTWGSAPIVVRDVIVVGGLGRGSSPPAVGDIRGYDVRSGKLLWTFHTVPRPGEFGNETWLKDSWTNGGNAGVWGFMSADEELGYVYVPTETSSSLDGTSAADFYGANRPGNNLFGETLLCLDAKTGKRVWHFQIIHHGLWDWDLAAPPILVDITVDGRKIKAVAQVTKQAFVYVFDRVTGQPVWPIEERPVPQGDMPGEWYSPTQPFPTKPPPFDLQDMTIDNLIDFTPELRQEALNIINQYHYGPLFTPPMMRSDGKKGTIVPLTATSTWNGAGIDPETGILYIPSVHLILIAEMVKPQHPNAMDSRAKNEWVNTKGAAAQGPWIEGPFGLPDPFKPPYGRLTAIDLNRGDILWTVANGDGPRNHPALKHLNLPRLGQGGRASPLVTKTLVLLGEGGNEVGALPPGGGGKMFRAYDKATGDVLWEMELHGGTTGAPMTYMANGKQYIAVTVGWKDMPAELIALALP